MVVNVLEKAPRNGSIALLEQRAGASAAASDRRLIDDAVGLSDRVVSSESATHEQATRLSRGE